MIWNILQRKDSNQPILFSCIFLINYMKSNYNADLFINVEFILKYELCNLKIGRRFVNVVVKKKLT